MVCVLVLVVKVQTFQLGDKKCDSIIVFALVQFNKRLKI